MFKCFFWIVLFFNLLFPCQSRAKNLVTEVHFGVQEIKSRLHYLRLSTSDLKGRPAWKLPHSLPKVENLIFHPLEAPLHLSTWSLRASQNKNLEDYILLSSELLFSNPLQPIPNSKNNPKVTNPNKDPLPDPLKNILKAVRDAQSSVQSSYENLSSQERRRVKSLFTYPYQGEIKELTNTAPFKKKTYKLLEKFKQEDMIKAAGHVLAVLDKELPNIHNLKQPKSSYITWRSPLGKIILAGSGDNIYRERDLNDVFLLVDLGGNNRYESPAASAKEGEIKIVIDLGENVTVLSTSSVSSAGSGVFGIGIMILDNPRGQKLFRTQSFSQGFGLCGVGLLAVKSSGSYISNRYSQGSAIFGVGIFSNPEGSNSYYRANLYSQGVGFTKGIGIFRHQGSSSTFLAGLVQPDPREPLGSTSLCQGVGYGPRAFAGGGIGLCVLKGNHLNVESSYFAQGAGYWHAAGSFMIEGDSNTIKARRYDQGSGVHQAIGSFFLKGNHNRITNWGVGPAYGWDKGIGWAYILGNHNTAKVDWGSGTASINASLSFSYFSGDKNKFILPGLGSGNVARDLVDYSIAIVKGKGNSYKVPHLKKKVKAASPIFTSAWGLLDFRDVIMDPNLELPKEEWNRLPPDPLSIPEGPSLPTLFQGAMNLPARDKVNRLLQVSSSFSVDRNTPRNALAQLLLLPDKELPLVIQASDPADFDGFMQIMAFVGIIGDTVSDSILDEIIQEKDPFRKLWLMSLSSLLRGEKSIPTMLKLIQDPDKRVQAGAIRVLGYILSEDNGDDAGRLEILSVMEKWLQSSQPDEKSAKQFFRRIQRPVFARSAAILSVLGEKTPQQRIDALAEAPPDIATSFKEENIKNLMKQIQANREGSLKAVQKELEYCRTFQLIARDEILNLIQSSTGPSRGLIHAAVTTLGKFKFADDAELIASYLTHSRAIVREAASLSLGRLGAPALPWLKNSMKSKDPKERIQALCSLNYANDPKFKEILDKGLKDRDPEVRNISLSMIRNLQSSLSKIQSKYNKKYKKSKSKDPQKAYLFGN